MLPFNAANAPSATAVNNAAPTQPASAASTQAPPPIDAEPLSMDALEKKAIIDALERCGDNRTKAAELLGLSRKTILNKIKAYGL
jgi:DNA-binding NtrC family response regulator